MLTYRHLKIIPAVQLLLILASCSPVKETATKEVEPEVKPLWSEDISKSIGEEFVNQLNIENKSGTKPVFLIGNIEATGVSNEIASGLEYDIELTLVNTGKVSFIEDKKARDNERENRRSMSGFETEEKFYTYYKNLNVDQFIEGKIIGETIDGVESSYILTVKVIDVKNKEILDWQKVITR